MEKQDSQYSQYDSYNSVWTNSKLSPSKLPPKDLFADMQATDEGVPQEKIRTFFQ